MLTKKSVKVLKAKDHDSQKGGTKVEQGELSYIINIDEAAYIQYQWCYKFCGQWICEDNFCPFDCPTVERHERT